MTASITTANGRLTTISSRPRLRDVMSELNQATAACHDTCGTDGCSIPTYAAPLGQDRPWLCPHGVGAWGSGWSAPGPPNALMAAPSQWRAVFYVAAPAGALQPTLIANSRPGPDLRQDGPPRRLLRPPFGEVATASRSKCEDGSKRGAEAMIGAVLAKFFARRPGAVSQAWPTGRTRTLKMNWNGNRKSDQIRPWASCA